MGYFNSRGMYVATGENDLSSSEIREFQALLAKEGNLKPSTMKIFNLEMANKRNNNSNYNNNNSNQGQKKHSGAKMGVDKRGLRYIAAWNYSKRFGMVSMIASHAVAGRTKKNGGKTVNVIKTKSGQTREIWLCALS